MQCAFSNFDDTNGRVSIGSSSNHLAGWNQFIKLAPDTFYLSICRDIPGTPQLRVQVGTGGGGTLHYTVNAGGSTIVESERYFDFHKFEVDHNKMKVEDGWQGKRIGRILTRNFFEIYRLLGLRTVHLIAGGEGGGYAWALMGFYTDQQGWNDVRREASNRLTAAQQKIRPDTFAAVRLYLQDPDPMTLWEVADLDYDVDGTSMGAYLLRGVGWEGWFDLEGAKAEECWERIYDYSRRQR